MSRFLLIGGKSKSKRGIGASTDEGGGKSGKRTRLCVSFVKVPVTTQKQLIPSKCFLLHMLFTILS